MTPWSMRSGLPLLDRRHEIRHPDPERAVTWSCTVAYSVLARWLGLGTGPSAAGEGDWDSILAELSEMVTAFLLLAPTSSHPRGPSPLARRRATGAMVDALRVAQSLAATVVRRRRGRSAGDAVSQSLCSNTDREVRPGLAKAEDAQRPGTTAARRPRSRRCRASQSGKKPNQNLEFNRVRLQTTCTPL